MKTFTHLFRCLLLALAMATGGQPLCAAVGDGLEFYLQNDYYDMVLGLSADGTTPRLSAYGTCADSTVYVMVAEASDTEGAYYIRNKGTGKYLTASTQNTWSLTWTDSRASGNASLWRFDVRAGSAVVSLQNTSKRLGCDWSEDDYVGVYYDKARNSMTRFTVIPAQAGGFEASRALFATELFENEQGVRERDLWQVNGSVSLSDTADLHVLSDTPFASAGHIDICNEAAWVVFENVRPSEVVSQWLSRISVNGQAAKSGTNVRVAIWLDGAAVIPCKSADIALQCYSDEAYAGYKLRLTSGDHSTLGSWNNRTRSFVLRRGYMAVVASGQAGEGYSRVYVADHADLRVSVLPDALNRRVSSVYIKPWQYTSKKGWCSTQGNSGIASGAASMEATWFYTWSADRSSTADCEYVPMQTHLYWPSVSDIASRTASLNMLSINEPEHSEQHDGCSCGGTVSAWKACTRMPAYAATHMRVGSPSPTDASWLTEFAGHVDDMAYRCDFVTLHAYWGANEADGASAWYNRLKAIYEATGRPIWITEWAYGASWTSESWPSGYSDQLEQNRKRTSEIVDMLERQPWIERYSYYQWDTSSRRFINDDGWVTPAGRMYRRTKSTFAYNADYQKVPNWWRPSAKQPTLIAPAVSPAAGGDRTLRVANPNGDCTLALLLQHYSEASHTWQTVGETTERALFDSDTLSLQLQAADFDPFSARYRAVAVTLYGDTTESTPIDLGYIANPDADQLLEGWTVETLSTNTGEAYDAEAANTYWNQWKANGLSSSMTQTVGGLPAGRYTLTALLRGGSNVTLTLQAQPAGRAAEAVSQTLAGRSNATLEDSPWANGWMTVELPAVELLEGDSLVITASAQGDGSAWWSADHFRLHYDVPSAISAPEASPDAADADGRHGSEAYDLSGRPAGAATRGIVVERGRKVLR